MIHRLALLLALLVFTLPVHAQDAPPQDRIVARVNADIITSGDVWSRYRMIQRSSKLPDTTDVRKEAFPQVLSTLIDEKLQLQEAKDRGLTVTDEDLKNGFEELAQRNKKTPEEFQAGLVKEGISIEEIKRQMRAQLGWTVIVQKEVRPSVTVLDSEIEKLANELNVRKGKKEFRVAEIILPAANAAQKADSMKLANRLTLEIRKGAPFDQVAQKFSKAPSAERSGLRGWVLQGELPHEIETVLEKMPLKALSTPIVADNGVWLVLKLEERQNAGAPAQDILRQKIGTRKLEQAAERYMRDLRDEALIEFPNT